MEFVEISPVAQPVNGRLRPPGSKSITNRALILAALAQGKTQLTGVLRSIDTTVMVEGLRVLGFEVKSSTDGTQIDVQGGGGTISEKKADIWCENSGTSIRFLTAMCAAAHGRSRLDGNARMRERPIAPLIDALRDCGVNARCEKKNGCPPVVVDSSGLPGGTIQVSGSISSQYLSGLLMVAPAAQGPVEIQVQGDLVSRPYVDMTIAMLRDFGAEISESAPNTFQIAAKPLQGRSYSIEPDASAASYFFAAAAITGGEVTVEGLHSRSLQGDIHFVDALTRMGCSAKWDDDCVTVTGGPLKGIDIDMNAISDTAQTLSCVAPFADGPTRIRNVAHMRVKETDRVAAVVTELRRVGLNIEEHDDGMTIHPGSLNPAAIETYDDHRMAMSFALLGLRSPGIQILDPGCTSKTYPHYFEDLTRLCGAAQ